MKWLQQMGYWRKSRTFRWKLIDSLLQNDSSSQVWTHLWSPLSLCPPPSIRSPPSFLQVSTESPLLGRISAKRVSLLQFKGFILKAASFQDRSHDVRRQLNQFYFTFLSLVVGGSPERDRNTRAALFISVMILFVACWKTPYGPERTQSMFYLINLLWMYACLQMTALCFAVWLNVLSNTCLNRNSFYSHLNVCLQTLNL